MNDLTSYTNLAATVADTLNRQDLFDSIPAFIALTEGEVNADDRFRCMASIRRSTAFIEDQYVPVPADFISMQNIRFLTDTGDGRGKLGLMTTDQMDDKRAYYNAAGRPKFYAMIGREMEMLPVPDQQYEAQMIYYATVPALGPNNPTNWLLQMYPNVYYYGALLQASPYLKNDERIATWGTMYNQIAERINESSDRAQFSGSTMKMRVARKYR